MGLREQINDSLKEAMKAKDQKRVGTLRLINAALKDKLKDLGDQQVKPFGIKV